MKLTILGCSGSLGAPGNPASGYLLSFPEGPSVIMDLGPGTLANLQELQNPSDAHVLFSHLHADHCLDFPSLMVWRRYHPERKAAHRHRCLGPAHTPIHLGRLSADVPDEVDDFSDTLDFTAWEHAHPETVGPVQVTPYRASHPIEAYALRVEDPASGAVIAYSGDSADHPNIVAAARDADLFLCEAGWGPTSEGKVMGMHMSGEEAGRIAAEAGAKVLGLVHIQPWTDQEATLAAARTTFDGDIILGRPGLVFDL
ncbi:MAG TPA: MBL fold metallo-hydrolase [Corynebacterium sp.]|nr:MBL fold metallo-hydrolase [Corynebacterium sp.]